MGRIQSRRRSCSDGELGQDSQTLGCGESGSAGPNAKRFGWRRTGNKFLSLEAQFPGARSRTAIRYRNGTQVFRGRLARGSRRGTPVSADEAIEGAGTRLWPECPLSKVVAQYWK